jgi:predicted phosphodiesterase
MSLVISDLHGNNLKLQTFIQYKPEEEHIVLGDFFDSFHASDEDIASTFKLAMDNNVTVTVGNHDVVYLQNAHSYFRCSGNRTNHMFVHLMETYKDRFAMSLIRDNFLLSHGGLSKKHGKPFDTVEEANDWINSEWDWYKNQPVVPETLSPLFDIGYIRGGSQEVSGVLWLTFGREKYDTRFSQVCGHTCSSDVRSMTHKNHVIHVCVDTPKFLCFNTSTREFEDFMLDEYKSPDKEQMRKIIERQF